MFCSVLCCDTTMISESANATRWRSWSGRGDRVAEPDFLPIRVERTDHLRRDWPGSQWRPYRRQLDGRGPGQLLVDPARIRRGRIAQCDQSLGFSFGGTVGRLVQEAIRVGLENRGWGRGGRAAAARPSAGRRVSPATAAGGQQRKHDTSTQREVRRTAGDEGMDGLPGCSLRYTTSGLAGHRHDDRGNPLPRSHPDPHPRCARPLPLKWER